MRDIPFIIHFIVKGEYLFHDCLPCPPCRCRIAPGILLFAFRPPCHQIRLGHHEQDAVKQPVILVSLFEQLMHTPGLCRADHVDAGILNVYGNGIADTGHIYGTVAPCGQKLLYQLPVVVTVGGIEHAHNLVRKYGYATGTVVMGKHQGFRCEIGHDGSSQYRSVHIVVALVLFHCILVGGHFTLEFLQCPAIPFAERTEYGFKRRCLAESRPPHHDDIKGGIGCPLSLYTDIVGIAQCGSRSRQHGCGKILHLEILMSHHAKDNVPDFGRENVNREIRFRNALRLRHHLVAYIQLSDTHNHFSFRLQ